MLLAFIFSFELNAQTNFQLQSPKENSLKDRDTINTTSFIFGAGYLSETHQKKYSPLIEINFNIHLYRSIYINIGSDAAVFADDIRHDSYGLFFAPNYAFHEEKNKISVFLGAGVYFLTPPIYMILGWVFLGRAQYNINRYFSSGIELKLVKSGDSEIEGHSYLSGLFYISIRF